MRPLLRILLGVLGSALLACVRKPAEPLERPTASPAPTPQAAGLAPDNVVKRRALYFPNAQVYGTRPEAFRELEVVTADTIIPPDMATALGEASPDAEVWLVEGADHNTLRKRAGAEYRKRLRGFLEKL